MSLLFHGSVVRMLLQIFEKIIALIYFNKKSNLNGVVITFLSTESSHPNVWLALELYKASIVYDLTNGYFCIEANDHNIFHSRFLVDIGFCELDMKVMNKFQCPKCQFLGIKNVFLIVILINCWESFDICIQVMNNEESII